MKMIVSVEEAKFVTELVFPVDGVFSVVLIIGTIVSVEDVVPVLYALLSVTREVVLATVEDI